MKEPKQIRLVFKYCLLNGSILPAKMYGEVWEGEMFGSESSKRCRELRKLSIFESRREGKFERFWIHPYLKTLKSILLNHDYTQEIFEWESRGRKTEEEPKEPNFSREESKQIALI